jgi:hypothetical protein
MTQHTPLPMNVCPDCEQRIVPRLHPNVRNGFTCNHKIAEMSGEELRAIFPNAVPVFRELAKQIRLEDALKGGK